MAEQLQNDSSRDSDDFSDSLTPDLSNRFVRLDANSPNFNFADDDLIAALQNRPENRRARQVFEWEIKRRQLFQINYLPGAA